MLTKTILPTIAFIFGLLSFTSCRTAAQLSLPLISSCGPNQYQTPSGCWSSCSSSLYSTCGDFFPALYNPSFCAYTIDGQYVSYTYDCQACKSTGVLAVTSGACDCSFIKCGSNQQCQAGQCIDITLISPTDPCMTMKCSSGYVCQNGQCISQTKPCNLLCIIGYVCQNGQCVRNTTTTGPTDLCASTLCRQGYYCKNGNCIAQVGLCGVVVCAKGYSCENGRCVSQQINPCATVKCSAGYTCRGGQCVFDPIQQLCQAKKYPCSYPRPNQTTCPTRYYFAAPTPNFCGIKFYGQQVNYPEQCDACKDTQIQYYWNKPCDQILNCENPIRVINQQIDLCANIMCIATTRCISGVCVPITGNLV